VEGTNEPEEQDLLPFGVARQRDGSSIPRRLVRTRQATTREFAPSSSQSKGSSARLESSPGRRARDMEVEMVEDAGESRAYSPSGDASILPRRHFLPHGPEPGPSRSKAVKPLKRRQSRPRKDGTSPFREPSSTPLESGGLRP